MIPAPRECASCTAEYSCGPVKLLVSFDDISLRKALDGLLLQYDAPWAEPQSEICVLVGHGLAPDGQASPAGDYLQSYRLHVDRRGRRLFSLSNVGVWMEFNEAESRARIVAPDHPDRETMIEEVEQQFVLLLARAWALQGWTPLHAGAVAPRGEDRCIFVCAPSGVGKTTLISAMLCRGWRSMGDDKVLLRREASGIGARALSRRVHLHPTLSGWFPEIGDIGRWPRYSRWTEKRMVNMEAVWPGQWMRSAVPAGLVQLEREEKGGIELHLEHFDSVGALHGLLRQIVIPRDAADAQPLMDCAAAAAPRLRAARLRVGNGAFADASTSGRLEETLWGLLS